MTRISYESQQAGAPTDFPCDPAGYECPRFMATGSTADCFADRHHVLYPRADYQTRAEKRAREADACKVTICRFVHDLIHLTEEPPPKPTRAECEEIIAGLDDGERRSP